MLLFPISFAVLAALFASQARAKDIDDEAARNGYQRLPPLLNEKSELGATAQAPSYVKVVEPRRKISILDVGAKREQPKSSYSLVSFEIDCPKMAMRYRAAQLLDPPWNPKGSNVPVQGPWHIPNKYSVQEQALVLACKA